MKDSLREVREACQAVSRKLLNHAEACHLVPNHRTDGCGYFRGQYCYLRVDCRIVRGVPLCWISIIDHYTGKLLLSAPCESTPGAAKYGAEFFMKSNRRKK